MSLWTWLFGKRKPAPLKAPKPGETVTVFRVLKEFHAKLPSGQYQRYVPGLTYNIRPGNDWLRNEVFKSSGWKQAGLVEVLKETTAKSLVTVKGRVK